VRRLIVMLAFVTACDGGSRANTVADAMPADAMPDGPSPMLFFGCDGVTELTTLELPDVRVGQAVSYSFSFQPGGGRLTPAASSSDPELVAHITLDRRLLVTFTPTAPGHREITVTVSATELRPFMTWVGTLTIVVDVLPASTAALAANTPLVTDPLMKTITLKNQSASTPIELAAATVTTDDGSPPVGGEAFRNCPRTLQPGDSCLVELNPSSRTLGCHRSAVTFHSSANDETVYVEIPSLRIMAGLSSPLGTITASPPGSCDAGGCVASPATLTATPNAGSRFVGWTVDSGCSTDPTCVFRPYSSHLAISIYGALARFAPTTARTVTLAVQGGGSGKVLFYEDDGSAVACEGSCTYASSGGVRLIAAAGSRFTGWTGACSGTIPQCNLGVLTGDVVVGATFDKDDRELATLAPPPFDLYTSHGAGGGFLPGGDVVIADVSQISRMTIAGSIVWTRPGNVSDLVTSAAGDVYYLSPSVKTQILYKLDPGGTVVWSRALHHPHDAPPCTAVSRLAVTASGDLAVISDQVLRVVSAATGAEVWTAPAPECRGVAADQAGHVVVAVSDPLDPEITRIQRYDAAGARQLPDWTLDGGELLDLELDPQGFLVARTWRQSAERSTLTRLTPTGVTVFSILEQPGYPRALAVASDGEIVTADATADGGTRLRRWSPAGVVTWTLDKPAFTSTIAPTIGVTVSRLAVDGSGRVLALGGQRIARVPALPRDVVVPWAALFAGP
jgi:hypothetical protein